MDSTSREATWQRLFGAILGYQQVWIVTIGLRSGLLRAFADAGDDGLTEADLIDVLDLTPRYLAIWCRAAYAYRILDHDDGRYRLAEHLANLLLDPRDPLYVGNRIQFFAALHDDFAAFPRLLRTGEVWPRSDHDPMVLDALKVLTEPDALMIADGVIPQVPGLLDVLAAGGSILDIGAGAGYALTQYARRFPAATILGIENDAPSVALAEQAIRGFGDRVAVRLASALDLDDADRHDLVTMNVALHETGGPAEYPEVLARAKRALRPGGTIIVSEIPYPDTIEEYRSEPIYQALSGLQIHEAAVGCGMISKSELRRLLDDAGFRSVTVATGTPPTRFVLYGQR